MHYVKNICIVGGGSAGWLTAAYLTNQLPQYNITLVESPIIPKLGVGEAALISFVDFLERCGVVSEEEFMKETKATFKCGILFKDWVNEGKDIWHPFANTTLKNGLHLGDYYSVNKHNSEVFKEKIIPYYTHCVKNNYITSNRSYHFDANLLADYLKKKTVNKLNYYLNNVEKVNVENNYINSIELDTGENIEASIFIDCTGFRNTISKNIVGDEWIDKSDMLFCNAAVTRRFKYNNINKEMTPYTISQACDLGWIFKIPVADRIGSGLLYNSNLTSKKEAEKFLVNHWGEDRLEDKNTDFNHIKFKPVYNKNTWKTNVISIGVSNGFAEPLESSSIHLTTDVIEHLTGRIRKGYYTSSDIAILNNRISQKFEETYDFIALHYLNNERDSIFWNHIKNNIKITDTLNYKIKSYVDNGIHDWDMDDGIIFAPHSWFIMFESLKFNNTMLIDEDQKIDELNRELYNLSEKFNITNNECLNG